MIDLEATMSDVLRADTAVIARVTDRCWLTMPAEPVFPALLVRRIAGAPPTTLQGALIFDDGQFDLHAYGGSRAEALGLAQDALAALCTATRRLGVQPLSMQRLPDPDVPQETGRDRERYIVSLRAFGR